MTTIGCGHGMPSPASCTLCMEDGPVADPSPGPTQQLHAAQWTTARHPGHCARRYRHTVDPGDPIGHVDGVGWCCEECAR